MTFPVLSPGELATTQGLLHMDSLHSLLVNLQALKWYQIYLKWFTLPAEGTHAVLCFLQLLGYKIIVINMGVYNICSMTGRVYSIAET